LGFLSAIMDNSALVAIAMQVFPVHDPHIWGLIGVTAGTGGSIMIFSSAAGVVAMGSMKELTVQKYLKHATIPALVGMLVGIGVWLLMYRFIWT
jgi:Na+/H+ antiporter NhaD/arsenite permease-like protein